MSKVTTKPTLITSRDRQGIRIMDLCAVAINKAKLEAGENRSGQRLIMNGGELQAGLLDLIKRLSTSEQFADEEVESRMVYPPTYKGPKPIEEQIKLLAEIFGVNPDHALAYVRTLGDLPEGAEGYFAATYDRSLAPNASNLEVRHCQATDLVLDKLSGTRPFKNWRKGELTPGRLRQHARTAHALDIIAEKQPGDIFVFGGQYGMLHRGKSIRRARETFRSDEFGLDGVILGCMALTHPERYVQFEELDTDCAGDEFSLVAVGQFDYSLFLYWYDGRLKFDTVVVDLANGRYGSASGFLPPQ